MPYTIEREGSVLTLRVSDPKIENAPNILGDILRRLDEGGVSEIQVSLSVETPDSTQGRQTKTATFTVSYFDFPMIDNTRLAGGDRCAVVLNGFSDQSADLTLVFFPGAYASLKEKPYYSEVIESIRRANLGIQSPR